MKFLALSLFLTLSSTVTLYAIIVNFRQNKTASPQQGKPSEHSSPAEIEDMESSKPSTNMDGSGEAESVVS